MQPFTFPGQTGFYRGKVRDVYYIGSAYIVMVASDRISAFDVVLPHPIPYKGQVLNQIAAYMLHNSRKICPNWLIDIPSPDVSIGRRCDPFKIELVVRGNLTGHAWRTYKEGKRILCGINLPEGMKENDFFPEPIITPTTKANEGHDEDISREEIIRTGLATGAEWLILEKYALALFNHGKQMACQQNLVLADTKYEFGKIAGEIILMDEIHTPDSSRYFQAEGFDARQQAGEKQKQLSKEFVREWLIENNFMGKEGQQVPEMTPAIITSISNRYIELYELVIGKKFEPAGATYEEIKRSITATLGRLEGYTSNP